MTGLHNEEGSTLAREQDKEMTTNDTQEKGGEIRVKNREFVKSFFKERPSGSYVAVCSKSSDPDAGGFKPLKAANGLKLRPFYNNYINISCFYRAADGSFNVKKENFAALICVVLDDVGTKIPWSQLDGITPTWVIETSPGNFQVGFVLAEPITDIHQAEALIKAVLEAGYSDKGAGGVSRWARLPKGINGKPKYLVDGQPFQCRLEQLHRERTYSVDELVACLGLKLKSAEKPSGKGQNIDKHPAPYEKTSTSDPVIERLKERKLYKSEIDFGKHDITCPRVDEHTDAVDDGAAYFEPSDEYPSGGFKCHHSHGESLNIKDLRTFLGLEKPDIKVIPGKIDEIVRTACSVLAKRGDIYVRFNVLGKIIRSDTGETEFMQLKNSDLTLLLVQGMEWVKHKAEQGWIPCDPPERHVRILLDGSSGFGEIPELRGIVRQPYFRETDGALVKTTGYDPITKLYGAFDPAAFPYRQPTIDNAQKSLNEIRELLSEFRFLNPVDEAVALSAILTAVMRPALDLAPGFHAHAATIGSGKSYLCKLIGLFASQSPSEKVSYPNSDEDATKKLLSLLMKSLACIEFDDMGNNWKSYTILKQMFTSEVVTDRLLGVNRTVTVSTRCLVLGSGNNVTPERDMRRRVLTIYLDPQVENPSTLSYRNDPVKKVSQNRKGAHTQYNQTCT